MGSKTCKKGCQYKFKQGTKKGKVCGKGCRGKYCKDHKVAKRKYFKDLYQNKKSIKQKEKIELIKDNNGKIPSLIKEQLKNKHIIDKINKLKKVIYGIKVFLDPAYVLPISKTQLELINTKETYMKDYDFKIKAEEEELKIEYRKKCLKHNNFNMTIGEYIDKNKKRLQLDDYDPDKYRSIKNYIEREYNDKCVENNTLGISIDEYIMNNKKVETFDDYFNYMRIIKLENQNNKVPFKVFEGSNTYAKTKLSKKVKELKKLVRKLTDHSIFLNELEKIYQD